MQNSPVQNEDIDDPKTNEPQEPSKTLPETKKEFHETISETVGSVRFKCSFCDYKSKYKQAVTHHAERIHLKKRDYNGDICQKSFHQDCDLRKHTNTGSFLHYQDICQNFN